MLIKILLLICSGLLSAMHICPIESLSAAIISAMMHIFLPFAPDPVQDIFIPAAFPNIPPAACYKYVPG
jgi:hypothetical protein